MAYPKRILEIVPECNDENDNPRCWAIRSEYDFGNERYHYIWICQYDDKEFIVENSNGYNLIDNKVYKTLSGAKRAAEEILWRQEETGSFSN